MLQSYTRPLDEDEAQLLEQEFDVYAARSKRSSVATLVFILLILAVGIPLAVRQAERDQNLLYLALVVVLVYSAIVIWVHYTNVSAARKRVDIMNEAIERNQAQVVRVRADEMVDAVEIEDEGAEYFFQVEENKVLYLGGQEYYPTDEFPNSDFELVSILGAKDLPITGRIVCRGEKLTPLRTIDKQTKLKMLDSSHYPQDMDLLEGRVERVDEIILRGG